jgi:hypothetical protein
MNVDLIGIYTSELRKCAIPEGREPADCNGSAQMANAPHGHIDGAGKGRAGIGRINGMNVFFA